MVADQKSGENKIYGQVDSEKRVKITNSILLEEIASVLCFKTEMLDGFPLTQVALWDYRNDQEMVIDAGEIIQITIWNETKDERNDSLTQEELDSILQKYQVRAIDLADAAKMFVQYHGVTTNNTGDKIFYSKALYRNVAPQGEGVILGSNIWDYDLKSGQTDCLYNAAPKSFITTIDLNSSGNKICFVERRSVMSEEGAIMEIDLGDKKTRVLSAISKESYVQSDPFYLDDNTLMYLSIAQGQSLGTAIRYLLDTQTGEKEIFILNYNGEKQLLRNFVGIN